MHGGVFYALLSVAERLRENDKVARESGKGCVCTLAGHVIAANVSRESQLALAMLPVAFCLYKRHNGCGGSTPCKNAACVRACVVVSRETCCCRLGFAAAPTLDAYIY